MALQGVLKYTNLKFMTSLVYQIAVVVFPTPDELRFRAGKRFKEMGKDVPAEAVNEMIGNYHCISKRKKSLLYWFDFFVNFFNIFSVNYVLPLTKNMHGSNELFDEVPLQGSMQQFISVSHGIA